MQVVNIGGARAAVVEYRSHTFYFLFNGYAYFALQDEFGKEFAKQLGAEPEYLGPLLRFSAILAEQGELARRKLGYEPEPILMAEQWGDPVTLQPQDMFLLQDGCVKALGLGYEQQVKDEDEEIDLGLLELQKKRTSPALSTSPPASPTG